MLCKDCGVEPKTEYSSYCNYCCNLRVKNNTKKRLQNPEYVNAQSKKLCKDCNDAPRTGVSSYCKSCRVKRSNARRAIKMQNPEYRKPRLRLKKEKRFLRDYGISVAVVDAVINCDLCLQPLNVKRHVDHDHKTGKIRGIVHSECNMLLGFYEKRNFEPTRITEYLNSKDGYGLAPAFQKLGEL